MVRLRLVHSVMFLSNKLSSKKTEFSDFCLLERVES